MFSAQQRARIDLGAQFGKRVGPLSIAVIVMASMLWSWDVFCQTPPTILQVLREPAGELDSGAAGRVAIRGTIERSSRQTLESW